jgi:hypothetical protein
MMFVRRTRMSAAISRLTQLPARVTMPAIILRLEGLTLFVGALATYGFLGYGLKYAEAFKHTHLGEV